MCLIRALKRLLLHKPETCTEPKTRENILQVSIKILKDTADSNDTWIDQAAFMLYQNMQFSG